MTLFVCEARSLVLGGPVGWRWCVLAQAITKDWLGTMAAGSMALPTASLAFMIILRGISKLESANADPTSRIHLPRFFLRRSIARE